MEKEGIQGEYPFVLFYEEVTDRELNKVLKALEQIPNEKERDDAMQIVLKAASESITLERLKKISSFREEEKKKEEGQGFIKFTKKEIESMPEIIQRLFVFDEKVITYRFVRGKYYQARYRRDGLNVEVMCKDFEQMKRKFIEKFYRALTEKQSTKYPKFREFVEEWLKIKKQTVKESTYNSYENLVFAHILPRFGKMFLNEITRKEIQDFLFGLVDQSKNRTAHKIKQLMSNMFVMIADDYDLRNPVEKVVLSHYKVKKGRAFTKDEEHQIIEYCKKNPYLAGVSAVLTLIYTGMRVGELPSIKVYSNYLTCITEKTRRGHDEVVRKIPFTPMLKKVIDLIDFEKARTVSPYSVRDLLKRIFPDRHVHEFRYTFITRAKECGVNPEVVMIWSGHEFDNDVKTSRVDRGYTTYSDEYLFREASKVRYEL